MDQLLIEAPQVDTPVDASAIAELSLAQLALVGGGEVQVTFD